MHEKRVDQDSAITEFEHRKVKPMFVLSSGIYVELPPISSISGELINLLNTNKSTQIRI